MGLLTFLFPQPQMAGESPRSKGPGPPIPPALCHPRQEFTRLGARAQVWMAELGAPPVKVGEFELSEGGSQPPPGDTFLCSEVVGFAFQGVLPPHVFGLRPLTLLSSSCGQVCRPRTHASCGAEQRAGPGVQRSRHPFPRRRGPTDKCRPRAWPFLQLLCVNWKVSPGACAGEWVGGEKGSAPCQVLVHSDDI